ncbi:UNVERIFIED_CONTAM: hypothetical protein RMT77_005585 [Armadillidium vulgare]
MSNNIRRGLLLILLSIAKHASSQESVPDAIRKHGYPCEEHFVTTSDGYILSLHRIPYGKDNSNYIYHHESHSSPSRQPVIMQHGLLSSSWSWTLELPHKVPAFIMADAGFDVWLTNVRGNIYSRNHTHLSPNSKEFWQFSWDEMALYDVTSFIDYVLNITKYKQLYYIGHSMGTTIFFAGMSANPSYNAKIKGMFALAPVATVAHIKSPVRFFAYYEKAITKTLEKLGEYEFLARDSYVMKVTRLFCSHFRIDEYMCENFLFLIVGFDKDQINTTWIPAIEDELLSGTSLYTVLHFGQEYISEKFRYYDFGPELNMKRYGQITPPDYDISKVTSPVFLFWAKNDYLADPQDVEFLTKNLVNIRFMSPVEDKKFNHLDFLWAKNAEKLVYQPIIGMMKTR